MYSQPGMWRPVIQKFLSGTNKGHLYFAARKGLPGGYQHVRKEVHLPDENIRASAIQ